MQKKYGNDKGFLLVALSDEPGTTVKPFVKKQNINYIVGADAKSTFKDFGIQGYPTIFVLDTTGEIVYKGHSPDDATEAVEETLKKGPPKPVVKVPLVSSIAKADLAKADKLYDAKEYDRALKEYEKLAKVYKENEVGKKAKAKMDKIRSDSKMMAQIKATEAKKKCEDWIQTARTLAKMGKSGEATKYYQRVLDEFPDSSYADTARREMAAL